MDKFGLPKKVNRHVIKAIYEGLEKPNLSNIYGFVKEKMKNNVPVPFLKTVVRQSLQNFHELGVIERKGTNYYRRECVDSTPIIPSKPINTGIFKKTVQTEKESNLNPNKRKRLTHSDDSIPENDPHSSLKRLRTSKPLSRKGHGVYLPRARSHHQDEIYECVEIDEQSSPGSHSDSDSECNSEGKEEKTSFFSTTEIVPSKSNENISKVTDSQSRINELSKFNINSVQVRVKKLDVLNKIDTQIDERRIEDLQCSESHQIPNESKHSNEKMTDENINDRLSLQSSLKLNEEPKSSEFNETKNEQQN
ncbi:uncharacterized protein LOC129951327 [Eupeodes corollae]|uniref:uncharacterized protein LOC129951327 n=1 Tax=Eupeodes corollae TaxID=290404 RepID=UPI002490EE42|nr:uncharacterized protein LOC129951327 [Eupeodes corollae]